MDGFTPDRKTKPKDPDTEEQNRRLKELAELSPEERMKQLAELKDFFTDRGEGKTEIVIQSPPKIKRKKFKVSGEELTTEQLQEYNAKVAERQRRRWGELQKRLQKVIHDESKSDTSEMSELDLNKEEGADEGCEVCVVQLAPTLRF